MCTVHQERYSANGMAKRAGDGGDMINVNTFAMQLLEFVESTVKQAIFDEQSRQALLLEANCAIIVLDGMVRRRAPELYPFVSFFTDYNLLELGRESSPTAKLMEALNEILKARKVFGQ
jgi:hypothetical protein